MILQAIAFLSAKQGSPEVLYRDFDGLPFNPLIPYSVKHPATGELFIQSGQHIAGSAVYKRLTDLVHSNGVVTKKCNRSIRLPMKIFLPRGSMPV